MTEFNCPVCDTPFSREGRVRDHTWDVHGGCHHCGKQFPDRESLFAHWLVAHDANLSRSDRKRAKAEVGSLPFRARLAYGGPIDAVKGIRVGRRAIIGGGAATSLALLGGAVAGGFFGGDQSSGSLGSHPAGEAIESQPMLGPAPTDAPATIIAYEDPSCPSCARFELGTFPQLKSELIDAIPPFSD